MIFYSALQVLTMWIPIIDHYPAVKYITQNSVFDAKVFEEDFLTWLDMSINDVSDVIVVCITPITATISANAVINYKDY